MHLASAAREATKDTLAEFGLGGRCRVQEALGLPLHRRGRRGLVEMQHALPPDGYGAVHTGEVLASPQAGVR